MSDERSDEEPRRETLERKLEFVLYSNVEPPQTFPSLRKAILAQYDLNRMTEPSPDRSTIESRIVLRETSVTEITLRRSEVEL